MTKSTTKSNVPQDRLTRICDAMLTTFNNHAEKRVADRTIMFLLDETKGGIAYDGYANEEDVLVDLLSHLSAMFRARGQELHFVAAGTTPPKDQA